LPAVQVTKVDQGKFRWDVFSIVEGNKFHLTFSAKKTAIHVKTVMIWRSILHMFQLENREPDKRQLYLNFFHGYGLKHPSTYQPINSGRTSRLLHQLRGVTHSIWCSDDHTFVEKVDSSNMVDLWQKNYSPEYKLSDEILDSQPIEGGEVTKEVVLEARSVQVLSRLILKSKRILFYYSKVCLQRRSSRVYVCGSTTDLRRSKEYCKYCKWWSPKQPETHQHQKQKGLLFLPRTL